MNWKAHVTCSFNCHFEC